MPAFQCETIACTKEVVHAEGWNNDAGYRLWCSAHVPRIGHGLNCGETCRELVRAVKAEVDALTQYGKDEQKRAALCCDSPGCQSRVDHAEKWNDRRGYRLWCAGHVPWRAHEPTCGEECKNLLRKVLGRPSREEEEKKQRDLEHFAAIGRETYRLWHRASVERHSSARLGTDIDKLMCWGSEEERERRRKETEDAEIRRYWVE